jgi:CIC family chloride channel protein
MTELNVDEIPVVEPDDPKRLAGLLSRRALTIAYTSLIEQLRSPTPTAHDGEPVEE